MDTDGVVGVIGAIGLGELVLPGYVLTDPGNTVVCTNAGTANPRTTNTLVIAALIRVQYMDMASLL
jgi:hypothetical protein